MKNRIKLTLALSSAALLLGGLSSVSAASVGVSFLGRADTGAGQNIASWTMLPGESAGVVAQTNWVNLPSEDPFDGSVAYVPASFGTYSTVSVSWTANDSWRNDGPAPTTPNQKMMKGILKAGGTTDTNVVFTFRGLSSGTYSVIAYGVHNNGGDGNNNPIARYTLGSTSYFMRQMNGFTNDFVQVTATTAPGAIGNYVRWDNVAPVDGVITFTMTRMDTTIADGVGLAGVQIIGDIGANTVAPAFTSDLPGDTSAAEGERAVFTVAPNGPWALQWYKNDVLIQGATGTTYTTPALTLADNNATFKCVAVNNVGQVTSRSAKVEVDAVTPPVLVQGFLKVEHYGNIGGTALTDLFNNAKYTSKTPDYVTYVAGAYSPDAVGDNYGRVLSGYIKLPNYSDEWTFFTRSDDASALWLNVDNIDPAVLPPLPDPVTETPWAKETGCCDAFKPSPAEETSTPFGLDGGIPYAIVAAVKEGGGGDYLYVAANTTPTVIPKTGTDRIPGAWCYVMASTAGKRFTITEQPVPATVVEGRTATFTTAAKTTPEVNAFGIQWQKNGADIPGATMASYTTPTLGLADGAKYRAKYLTLLGEKFSDEVQLTVVPDTIAPTIASAGAVLRGATGSNYDIGIIFDEALKSGMDVPGNYTLSKGTLSKVRYSQYANKNTPISFGASVSLEVTGIAPGDSITVTAKNIEDLKGNKGDSTKQFTVPATPLRWAIVGAQENVTDAATAITFVSDAAVGQVKDGVVDIDMLSSSQGMWADFDEATFAYEEITGDFDRCVRVEYQDNSSQWARAGLMARAAVDEGMNRTSQSNNVAKAITMRANPVNIWDGAAGNNQIESAVRAATGGEYAGWLGAVGPVLYPNAWMRMTRVGELFTGYYSADGGTTWSSMGTYTYASADPMPAKVYFGPFFAPELGNNGTKAGLGHSPLARFRSYGDTSVVFAAPGQPEITGATIVGNQATITWTGGGKLQQSAALGGTASWTDVPGQGAGTATVTIGTSGNMFFQVRK